MLTSLVEVTSRRLTPTSYALLGYLSMTPMSGYDLASAIRKSVDQFWPVSKSQIYKELPQLEAEALIQGTAVAQDQYPDKRIYTITRAGVEALDDWLHDETLPNAVARIPELLKLFFGHRMDDDAVRTMLLNYRRDRTDSIERLELLLSQLEDVPGTFYVRATARYGLLDSQMVVEWIDETLTALDQSAEEQGADGPTALDAIRNVPQRPRDATTQDFLA